MSTLDTRAVSMVVPPIGSYCEACEREIKFVPPPGKGRLIVANVYEGRGKNRRWTRMEHWHPECYDGKGQPYGEAPHRKTTITSRTSW